jgi:hypothetical protein
MTSARKVLATVARWTAGYPDASRLHARASQRRSRAVLDRSGAGVDRAEGRDSRRGAPARRGSVSGHRRGPARRLPVDDQTLAPAGSRIPLHVAHTFAPDRRHGPTLDPGFNKQVFPDSADRFHGPSLRNTSAILTETAATLTISHRSYGIPWLRPEADVLLDEPWDSARGPRSVEGDEHYFSPLWVLTFSLSRHSCQWAVRWTTNRSPVQKASPRPAPANSSAGRLRWSGGDEQLGAQTLLESIMEAIALAFDAKDQTAHSHIYRHRCARS